MISVYRLVSTSIAVAMLVTPSVSWPACSAQSGTHTSALVELYTSEGCSSCPPADDELRRIRQVVGPSSDVVALAMHVDYWDSLGWKDPYAQSAFAARQRSLVQQHDGTTVYTPHFFISGNPLLAWQRGLPDAVHRLNARPAAADIHIAAALSSSRTLAINADVTSRAASRTAALYLAVAESGLSSKVTRGENTGATLAHDHVVRAWIGPIRLGDGSTHEQRTVTLPDDWNALRLEVVGFVADETTGAVLQAISVEGCARS